MTSRHERRWTQAAPWQSSVGVLLRLRDRLLIGLAIGLMTQSAFAGDGVIEINHVCAEQTGCMSGDSAGYPVSIDGSAGHSYRLTGDLIVSNLFVNAIRIAASNISIDLNGFAIIRSDCAAVPNSCLPPSTGFASGIDVNFISGGLYVGNSVKNGSVVGMAGSGVRLHRQSEVVNVRSRANRLAGIVVFDGSSLFGNVTSRNGVTGIFGGDGSTVSGNTSFGNGGDGIAGGVGASIAGNTSYANTGHGINADDGSLVQGNTVRGNTLFGLELAADAAFLENVITGNSGGTVNGGVNMLDNSCDGTTTCP